ncbi:DUF1127 domain-containing protein [Rhizobium sp. SGZ-381]|uniref:DUF1127 domain-containing protein n=1 Tax=Rhizobium sp. SGZ-381 TaxID=3342800 RepID=UPI0036707C14
MSTTERTMTRTLSATRKGNVRLFADVIASAADWSKTVLRALRNRRALTHICELEDHQLFDIGLTRLEVERAMSQSGLLQDPHALLPPHARLRGRRAPWGQSRP